MKTAPRQHCKNNVQVTKGNTVAASDGTLFFDDLINTVVGIYEKTVSGSELRVEVEVAHGNWSQFESEP